MSEFLTGFVFVCLLIILNGVLAMAEMAIVAARRPRLQQMADDGDDGARTALTLSEDPGDFLSAIQIGITLIGIITGAFSGATLSEPLAAVFEQVAFLQPIAEPLAVAIMVILTTYLSLVVGELVPKRIALNDAEQIASRVARPMQFLARLTAPLVWLLDHSSAGVLLVLGVKPSDGPPVTEEEVRVLIEQGAQAGVFEPIEEEIMDQVFRLSDRTITAIMTPRRDIIWFDVTAQWEEMRAQVVAYGHSRYPVARGDLDNVVGVVMVKDMLGKRVTGEPMELETIVQPPLFVPESMPALELIERLRETQSHVALVIDEYGGLEGLVTFTDVMRAILGEVPGNMGASEPPIVQREDGSWLVDGMLPVDDFKDEFAIKELPDEENADYQTLGGMIMTLLERVPATGDKVTWAGYHLEVVDMDGRRVDKVLVAKL